MLDLNEVSWGWSGSSGGGNRKDFGRKSKITSRSLWMIHNPSGIRVNGEIPPGHYSKKEMKALTEDLKTKLLVELEQKVQHGNAQVGRNRRRN